MLNQTTIENTITLKETFSLLKFMAKDKEIKINTFLKAMITRLNKKGLEIDNKIDIFLSKDQKEVLKYIDNCIETFIKYNMITTGFAYVGVRFKNTKTTKTIKLTTKGANVQC